MNELMTEAEVQMMAGSKSRAEWNTNSAKVQAAHGSDYPADWYEKVILSGLATKTAASWGTGHDARIHIR